MSNNVIDIKMNVTVNKKAVTDIIEKGTEVTLLACGEFMQGALARNTHRQTGLLANSHNYRVGGYQSDFGNEPMVEPKQTLTSENYVSQPPKNAMRVGSVLQYTEPYNDRFKLFEQTIDTEQSKLGKIANASFKKVSK